MSKEGKKTQNNGKPTNTNNSGGNVVMMPDRCPVCNGKAKRASFCEEHFMWFKEGLVNKKGEKPKDFDKKYQAYLRRQKQAA